MVSTAAAANYMVEAVLARSLHNKAAWKVEEVFIVRWLCDILAVLSSGSESMCFFEYTVSRLQPRENGTTTEVPTHTCVHKRAHAQANRRCT